MEFGKTNAQVAYLFRCVASSYTLRNYDRFRILAYERGADIIENLKEEIYDLWQSNAFKNIAGIGETLTKRLDDYFKNGNNSYLVNQVNQIPKPVYTLMQLPGIGAKTALRLVEDFKFEKSRNILSDIEKVAKKSLISRLEGFGDKSEQEILNSIKMFKSRQLKTLRMRLDQAYEVYFKIADYLYLNNKIRLLYPVGSLRRFSSTIGDVDVVAVCKKQDSKAVIDYFTKYPHTQMIEGKGESKGAIVISSGVHVQLRTTPPDELGSMLQYNTGSKEHNIKLREYALKKNLSVSEYGIKNIKTSAISKFSSELDFYRHLGLQLIPPELRQGTDEIQCAKANLIPKLVEKSDIRGDLQIHSNYPIEPSHDHGDMSYKEIILKASEKKYQYVSFTDHNPSITRHSNLQIISLLKKRQQYIVNNLFNKVERTKYFISLEVDIRPDGTLSLPDEGVKYLDFVLVSIHSSFNQTRDEITKRILKALQFPKVKILGHPTNRLINQRDKINADWDLIFKEAKKRNIAIEINGSPERLDLPENLVAQAKKIGCKFSLGTDSHKLSHMDNMFFAVSLARRGGLTKNDIINTMSYSSIKSFLLTK